MATRKKKTTRKKSATRKRQTTRKKSATGKKQTTRKKKAGPRKGAARKKSASRRKAAKKQKAEAKNDPKLLGRLRSLTARRKNLREQQMFGGYCFLYNGHMAFGVTGKDELMVRVGKDAYDDLLEEPHAREMKFTGRALRGLIYVDPPGIRTKAQLQKWVERGIKFAKSLPPK